MRRRHYTSSVKAYAHKAKAETDCSSTEAATVWKSTPITQ